MDFLNPLFTAVGGAGVIVIGLAVWLGGVWGKRIASREAAADRKELEALKRDLDSRQAQTTKLSDERFRIYSELWGALADLGSFGDELWERVTPNALTHFVHAHRAAVILTNRGRLLLTEDHYRQLTSTLETFGQYSFGKGRLLELRTDEQLDDIVRDANLMEIHRSIRENGATRDRYRKLLGEIAAQFRTRLGLAA